MARRKRRGCAREQSGQRRARSGVFIEATSRGRLYITPRRRDGPAARSQRDARDSLLELALRQRHRAAARDRRRRRPRRAGSVIAASTPRRTSPRSWLPDSASGGFSSASLRIAVSTWRARSLTLCSTRPLRGGVAARGERQHDRGEAGDVGRRHARRVHVTDQRDRVRERPVAQDRAQQQRGRRRVRRRSASRGAARRAPAGSRCPRRRAGGPSRRRAGCGPAASARGRRSRSR